MSINYDTLFKHSQVSVGESNTLMLGIKIKYTNFF